MDESDQLFGAELEFLPSGEPIPWKEAAIRTLQLTQLYIRDLNQPDSPRLFLTSTLDRKIFFRAAATQGEEIFHEEVDPEYIQKHGGFDAYQRTTAAVADFPNGGLIPVGGNTNARIRVKHDAVSGAELFFATKQQTEEPGKKREIEFPIELRIFVKLLPFCDDRLQQDRCKIPLGKTGLIADVDFITDGEMVRAILIEVEKLSARTGGKKVAALQEQFPWIGKHVTGQPEYGKRNLARILSGDRQDVIEAFEALFPRNLVMPALGHKTNQTLNLR